MDDKLVAQNPRDSLIVMRNQNLVIEKERKIKNNAAGVEAEYSKTLEKFSRQFLRVDAFHSLTALQKKELDKLCASYCGRRIFWNWLPFAGSLSSIIYLGFINLANLFLIAPWLILWYATFFWIEAYEDKNGLLHFFDHIKFLIMRSKIKKAEILENKK